MNIKHYTYRVTWSSEDEQHVGLCVEFPSLSWLADDPQAALDGIMTIVAEVLNDHIEGYMATEAQRNGMLTAEESKSILDRYR